MTGKTIYALDDWQSRGRIRSILDTRVLASEEQLLAKVCEFGYYQPTPRQMRRALQELLWSGEVDSELGPGGLYYFRSREAELQKAARREELYPVMSEWVSYSRNASQLIRLMEAAADDNPQRKGDLLILTRKNRKLRVRVLNSLHWCEGTDIQADALVARKIEPSCLALLKSLGIPCFQTHVMYFPPLLQEVLEPVRDKDLGGLPLVCTDELPRGLVDFMNRVVWAPTGRQADPLPPCA